MTLPGQEDWSLCSFIAFPYGIRYSVVLSSLHEIFASLLWSFFFLVLQSKYVEIITVKMLQVLWKSDDGSFKQTAGWNSPLSLHTSFLCNVETRYFPADGAKYEKKWLCFLFHSMKEELASGKLKVNTLCPRVSSWYKRDECVWRGAVTQPGCVQPYKTEHRAQRTVYLFTYCGP